MLKNLTIEQIKQIIQIAESVNAKPASPVFDVVDDKDGARLNQLLSTLSLDAAIELKAMMWMGRGDCATFDDALTKAGTRANPLQGTAPISGHKSPIPEYLRQAAAALDLSLD